MEKFNRTLRGYDPEEVNRFLDQVISQVEKMVSEIKDKDTKIVDLESKLATTDKMRDKLAQYERMEQTLNRALYMAQKTSDQMRASAYQERESILEEAKSNASRIVNESLLRAEKTQFEANMLRRNINIFKRRIKDIVEAQLELVDDLDKEEL